MYILDIRVLVELQVVRVIPDIPDILGLQDNAIQEELEKRVGQEKLVGQVGLEVQEKLVGRGKLE